MHKIFSYIKTTILTSLVATVINVNCFADCVVNKNDSNAQINPVPLSDVDYDAVRLASCVGNNLIDLGCDNSCVNLGTGALNQAAILAKGAFVAYPVIDGAFSMWAAEGKNCTVPSQEVSFNYTLGALCSGGVRTLSDGQSTSVCGLNFRGTAVNDMICVEAMVGFGWVTMGCKFTQQPIVNSPTIQSCYVSDSCSLTGVRHSQTNFPVATIVMECVKDTIKNVFYKSPTNCNTSGTNINMLQSFQIGMRKAVFAAITLYVMFFGIRVALGQDQIKKSEIFMFIAKMVLVIYFSVGFNSDGSNNYSNDGSTFYNPSTSGKVVTQNGIGDIVLPFFNSLMNSLSNLMINAANGNNGTSSGLCVFNQSQYCDGYEYLAVWDALDCRLMYYLGFGDPNPAADIKGMIQSRIMQFILPALFSCQIVFLIFSILFVVLLLSAVVYFVNTYIIAMIALAIVGYLGPLFVPMALFQVTKTYFDAWLRLLFSFALQPVVIAAFIALMMTIFDGVYYNNCSFDNQDQHGNNRFVFKDVSVKDETCQQSPGYLISSLSGGVALINIPTPLFNVVILNPVYAAKLIPSMATLVLFAFLFYYFGETLSEFAADLTGGPALGRFAAFQPNSITNAAMAAAKQYLNAKAGGKSLPGDKDRGGIKGVGGAGSGGDGGISGVGGASSGGGGGGIKGVGGASGGGGGKADYKGANREGAEPGARDSNSADGGRSGDVSEPAAGSANRGGGTNSGDAQPGESGNPRPERASSSDAKSQSGTEVETSLKVDLEGFAKGDIMGVKIDEVVERHTNEVSRTKIPEKE